jgi:hypothetical protein
LVLPLLLVFLLGIIDVGHAMWTWNRAQKATQVGVRFAVATDLLAAGLVSHSFAADPDNPWPQGDPVPEDLFAGADCTSEGCTCKVPDACPDLGEIGVGDFDLLVGRMQRMLPDIEAEHVVVEYRYSGLGFSGDPNGADVAPLVTVRLQGLAFKPITFMIFNGTIELPGFDATMSLEDGEGSESN